MHIFFFFPQQNTHIPVYATLRSQSQEDFGGKCFLFPPSSAYQDPLIPAVPRTHFSQTRVLQITGESKALIESHKLPSFLCYRIDFACLFNTQNITGGWQGRGKTQRAFLTLLFISVSLAPTVIAEAKAAPVQNAGCKMQALSRKAHDLNERHYQPGGEKKSKVIFI